MYLSSFNNRLAVWPPDSIILLNREQASSQTCLMLACFWCWCCFYLICKLWDPDFIPCTRCYIYKVLAPGVTCFVCNRAYGQFGTVVLSLVVWGLGPLSWHLSGLHCGLLCARCSVWLHSDKHLVQRLVLYGY